MDGIDLKVTPPPASVQRPHTADWLDLRTGRSGKWPAGEAPGAGWIMQPPTARWARDIEASMAAAAGASAQPAPVAAAAAADSATGATDTTAGATDTTPAEPPMSARMMASERAFGAAMMSLAFGPVPTLHTVALRLLINVGLGESVDRMLRFTEHTALQAAGGEQTASTAPAQAQGAAVAQPAAAVAVAAPATQPASSADAANTANVVSPAAYYVERDRLSLSDLRLMAGPDVPESDLNDALAQLPASLKSAFKTEYDAYANQIAESGAKIVMHWLELITESQEQSLDGATLSLALPLARPGLAPLTDGHAVPPTAPRGADTIGRGYVLDVSRPDSTERYFVSTRTGAFKKLEESDVNEDWIKTNRELVFDSQEGDPAAAGPAQFILHPMGSGTLDTMATWLAPALKADIEGRRDFASTYKGRRDYAEPVIAWLPFRDTAAALARMDAFSGRSAFVRELAEMPPLHHMWVSAVKLSKDLEEDTESAVDRDAPAAAVAAGAGETSPAAPAATTDSARLRARSSGFGFDPSLRA